MYIASSASSTIYQHYYNFEFVPDQLFWTNFENRIFWCFFSKLHLYCRDVMLTNEWAESSVRYFALHTAKDTEKGTPKVN